MRTKALNIPQPSRKPTRFVVQTPRSRIISMSTSGLGERVSARIQATASTTASRGARSCGPSSQPQFGASLIASEQADEPEREQDRARPVDLPGARTGDSGMSDDVAIVVTTITTSGIQKSQW